jgi:hypothetical protein
MQIGSESASLLDEPYIEQTQKAGTLKNLVAEVLILCCVGTPSLFTTS